MAVTINGDGLIQVDGTSTTQGRVRLNEDTDNGTNYIELTAPASVTANRTITFPDSDGTVINTAPGTNGNVLTSNGSAWVSQAPSGGVTSLNGQTGAITNTGLDNIGSYAILWYGINFPNTNTYEYLASGATIAGSSLRRSTVTTGPSGTAFRITTFSGSGTPLMRYNNTGGVSFETGNTTTMSGTWRVVGGNLWGSNVDGSTDFSPLLWVRIS